MVAKRQQCVVAVVDDDLYVRESLERLLDSATIKTRSFRSAEEALRLGGFEAICCLITDVSMPGMDGLELKRHTSIAFAALPVIFVTGHHDENLRQRAFSMGAFAFFYKPFDAEELLSAVDDALLH